MFRRRFVLVRRPRILGAALVGGAGFLLGRRRGSPPAEPTGRLSELARLHQDGSLTDEEFAQAKREVLDS